MKSLDSDGFFKKGVMCDTFKTSRKEPDSKDKLITFVMGAILLGKISIIW